MKKALSLIVLLLITISCFIPAINIDKAHCMTQAWDSRDLGWVTSVKKQKDGICWAFAICAAAETDAIAQGYVSDIDFSEGYLYAIHNLYTKDKNSATASGDTPEMVMKISQQYNPLATEKDYPYALVDTYGEKEISINPCQYTITSFGDIEKDKVKDWIVEHGAVICGFNISDDNKSTYVNNYEDIDENHVVTIVGWDDTVPSEWFDNPPMNDGAWLCKNSWGEEAEDNGYFWLSYEDASINAYFGLTVGKKDTLKRNGTFPLNNYGKITVKSNDSVSDHYGIGNFYSVKGGSYVDSVTLLLNENSNYTYKVYSINNTPSISNLNENAVIKSGNLYSDFKDISMVTIDIDYITYRDCYLFIEIISDSKTDLIVGAEPNKAGAYTVRHQNNQTISVKATDNFVRMSLNCRKNYSPTKTHYSQESLTWEAEQPVTTEQSTTNFAKNNSQLAFHNNDFNIYLACISIIGCAAICIIIVVKNQKSR